MEGLSAHHFIGFIENHNQAGNRATGERLNHLVGTECAKVAAGIALTAPFVPMLFQGEEFAASTPFLYFADHDDPEMAKLVSEGRKKEFAAFGFAEKKIPDPEARETFQRSKLNWQEVDERGHREILEWYRTLIQLRRKSVSLNDGNMGHIKVRYSEEQRWLTMDRGGVRTLANLGQQDSVFDIPDGFRARRGGRGGGKDCASSEHPGGALLRAGVNVPGSTHPAAGTCELAEATLCF